MFGDDSKYSAENSGIYFGYMMANPEDVYLELLTVLRSLLF